MNYSKTEREIVYLIGKHAGNSFEFPVENVKKWMIEIFDSSPQAILVALEGLQKKKRLVKNGVLLKLTPAGITAAETIQKTINRQHYDEAYSAIAASKAHGLYLERLCGKNWGQINLISSDSIDLLIEQLPVIQNHRILDLGCGLGVITEYIADRTGAHCTGYDYSKAAIRMALQRTERKRMKLDFKIIDLEHIPRKTPLFDVLISIDGLYSLSNLNKTVKDMRRISAPGGQWGIFFGNNGKKKTKCAPGETKFGRILTSLEIEYSVIDFSAFIKDFWERSKAVATALQKEFAEENKSTVREGLIKQAEFNLKNAQWASYYLYIVKP